MWAIGDWLNYGERRYGEMYAQEKAAGALKRGSAPASPFNNAGVTLADLGIDRGTIHRWRKRLKDEPATAYELSVRIDNLSFKHLGCMSP